MKKTVFIVMILTLFSKMIGFCREIVLSYFYGTSSISDAYLISADIPEVMFNIIGVGILTTYIPLYNKIEEREGGITAENFTNNVINMNIVFSSILFLLGSVYTKPIVKLFASGFDDGLLNLTIHFTKISLTGIFFIGLTGIYIGYLQIKDNFWAPALVGVPFNFFIITSIIISSKTSLKVLPMGIVAAMASQFLFLIPSLRSKKYRYRIAKSNPGYLKEMFFLSIPIIIGVSIEKINLLVDRTLASRVVTGGITTLVYADRINSLIVGIFVIPLVTVMYPHLSKLFNTGRMVDLGRRVSASVTGVNLLTIPSVVGIMIFSEPLVEVIYGRGAFDSRSLTMTSSALFFYSIGVIGFGLREVLTRVFYAMQDTKTPMINATIAIVLNITLNFILSRFMGIDGLALATSISGIFCATLLSINLKRRSTIFDTREIGISLVKILISSLIMAGMARLSFHHMIINEFDGTLSLIISVLIGIVIYFSIIYHMKISSVDEAVEMIMERLSKKMK